MLKPRTKTSPVMVSRMCTDAPLATISRSSGASQQRQVTGEPFPNGGLAVLFATFQTMTVPSDKPHARQRPPTETAASFASAVKVRVRTSPPVWKSHNVIEGFSRCVQNKIEPFGEFDIAWTGCRGRRDSLSTPVTES